jgi:hypothetical protein
LQDALLFPGLSIASLTPWPHYDHSSIEQTTRYTSPFGLSGLVGEIVRRFNLMMLKASQAADAWLG